MSIRGLTPNRVPVFLGDVVPPESHNLSYVLDELSELGVAVDDAELLHVSVDFDGLFREDIHQIEIIIVVVQPSVRQRVLVFGRL